MIHAAESSISEQAVRIELQTGFIHGTLSIPARAEGTVVFAHGSGSSRHSPRNRFVAEMLQHVGLATLLVDLLTEEEERTDYITTEHRFDIDLLADRLSAATDWLANDASQYGLRVGYFGASTGGAAALKAAAGRDDIGAIVSRGGRPDLAGDALEQVSAATLLIVGALDLQVIEMNRDAFALLEQTPAKEMTIIAGASHLFEEPGTLEEVAQRAALWFQKYLLNERRL
jgi:putative phosphoribosyl transferase